VTLRFERKQGQHNPRATVAPDAVIGALERRAVGATLHLWKEPHGRGAEPRSLIYAKSTSAHVGRVGLAGPTECILVFDPTRSPPGYTLERTSAQITDLRPAHTVAAAPRAAPVPLDLKKRNHRVLAKASERRSAPAAPASAGATTVPRKAARARSRIRGLVRDLHETLDREPGTMAAAPRSEEPVAPKPRGRPPRDKTWDGALGKWVGDGDARA